MSEQTWQEKEIADWLFLMADLKARKIERRMADAMATVLAAYPRELVRQAILSCAADENPHLPPVGGIIARIADRLAELDGPHGYPAILNPGDAWRVAQATLRSYSRETRPNPQSGDPAVDAALRRAGGRQALTWEDDISEGIARRRFMEHYAETSRSAQHVAWALQSGGRVVVVPGLALAERQEADWTATSRQIPAWLARGYDDTRGAVATGRARPDPKTLALPAPGSVTLTDEEREHAYANFKAEAQKLIAAWSLGRVSERQDAEPTIAPVNEANYRELLADIPVVDVSQHVKAAQVARAWKEEQAEERRDRYG